MPEEAPQLKFGSYFDPGLAATTVKLLPGEYFASSEQIAITTLLGSCVSVCLHDPAVGVGGMNHFMLPEFREGGKAPRCSGDCRKTCSARYGSCAMRRLLELLEQLGASVPRLQAKLFGAGRVMAGATDIGAQNASFAVTYLERLGIPVVTSDLGERCPRRVVFYPQSGRAWVKRLREREEI